MRTTTEKLAYRAFHASERLRGAGSGGYIGVNGKENGNYYYVYWGCIGIIENKMETTGI